MLKKVSNKIPNKKEIEETLSKKNTNQLKPPQKKPVILLLFLSIITIGIYPAIWYIKRSSEFTQISSQKLSKKLSIFYLILIILTIISILPLILETIIINNFQPTVSTLDLILLTSKISIAILSSISTIIGIYLAIKSKNIINEALKQKGSQTKLSTILTIFLNIYYLQYEINRIMDNKENSKRTIAWIFFALMIILVISLSALQFIL